MWRMVVREESTEEWGPRLLEALSGLSGFNPGHVQPATVLGSIVNLQPLGDAPRFRRLKRLVQRGRVMGVQSLPRRRLGLSITSTIRSLPA